MTEEIKFWTPESLNAFAQETKNVLIHGNYFQIKKLKADLLDRKGDFKTLDMIKQGLSKPELSTDELKSLPVDIVKDLAKAITEFSGISAEDAEKN